MIIVLPAWTSIRQVLSVPSTIRRASAPHKRSSNRRLGLFATPCVACPALSMSLFDEGTQAHSANYELLRPLAATPSQRQMLASV